MKNESALLALIHIIMEDLALIKRANHNTYRLPSAAKYHTISSNAYPNEAITSQCFCTVTDTAVLSKVVYK
jgi:hypothetical protein